MKSAEVDAYVGTFPRPVQVLLRKVRRTIREAAPDAEEFISYRMPAYRRHGVLVYFAGFQRHIGLFPPVRGNAASAGLQCRGGGHTDSGHRVPSHQGVSMSRYQLAQINIATLKAPLDSPELKDFVDNLDRINALAESSDGFVWRLKGEGNDATSLRPFGDDVIVNMSVWRDADALRQYVYKSAHVEILRRKREWFSRMSEAYYCLWWVPAGHQPTIEEAAARLEHLRKQGPTRESFHFGEAFAAPDTAVAGAAFSFKDSCPA